MIWTQIDRPLQGGGMEIFMKKIVLCMTFLLLIIGTAGCTKEDMNISIDDITTNTLLAKSNGELQVATVENFNKPNYKISELKDFIKQEIDTYNKSAGEEKIKIIDVVQHEDKAIMLLNYTGMDQYATFNKVTAAYFTGGVKDISLDLPATLINVKNNSLANTKEILQNEKYRILVLNEPGEIIVDGKVKYYSENSKLLEDNKIQGATEGMTIIVFR